MSSIACKKDNFAFTFIRQEVPCSEKFFCYFWLSKTDRKCAASADIDTCCLRSVCRSRVTCIVSTIKTIERKTSGYCVAMLSQLSEFVNADVIVL